MELPCWTWCEPCPHGLCNDGNGNRRPSNRRKTLVADRQSDGITSSYKDRLRNANSEHVGLSFSGNRAARLGISRKSFVDQYLTVHLVVSTNTVSDQICPSTEPLLFHAAANLLRQWLWTRRCTITSASNRTLLLRN